MKVVFAVFILSLGTSASAYAWDGDRQGFLLGVGAGTINQVIANDAKEAGNFAQAIGNSRIGYAFDSKNAVLLYSQGLYSVNAGINPSVNATYTGLNYQNWSKDEPQSSTKFAGFGVIGMSAGYSYDGNSFDPEYGFGVNFGYGREVVKHTSIELNIVTGYIPEYKEFLFGISTTFNLLGY